MIFKHAMPRLPRETNGRAMKHATRFRAGKILKKFAPPHKEKTEIRAQRVPREGAFSLSTRRRGRIEVFTRESACV